MSHDADVRLCLFTSLVLFIFAIGWVWTAGSPWVVLIHGVLAGLYLGLAIESC